MTSQYLPQDQYAIQLFSIFQLSRVDYEKISGGIVAYVVPSVTDSLAGAVEKLSENTVFLRITVPAGPPLCPISPRPSQLSARKLCQDPDMLLWRLYRPVKQRRE